MELQPLEVEIILNEDDLKPASRTASTSSSAAPPRQRQKLQLTTTSSDSAAKTSSSSSTARPARPRPASVDLLSPNQQQQHQRPSAVKSRPLAFLEEIRNRGRLGSQGEKPKLSFLKELRGVRQTSKDSRIASYNSEVLYQENYSSSNAQSPMSFSGILGGDENCLKMGNLVKTSRSRGGKSAPGHSRQRRFRLTPEALEYLHTFSHVRVKRSYPLTALEQVEYEEEKSPLVFQLIFSTYVMTLQAESASEARDWVEKINNAWSLWKVEVEFTTQESIDPIPEEDEEREGEGAEKVGVVSGQGHQTAKEATPTPAVENKDLPQRFHGFSAAPIPRMRTSSGPSVLRRESTELDTGLATYDSRKRKLSRRAFKIARLRPHLLERTNHKTVHHPEKDHDPAQDQLHREFTMIKYPNKILHLPSERVFTVDKDNLQILWRSVTQSNFRQKSSLSLRRIVEVRRGQQTLRFDKFPYEQVEDQSFSLLFEVESNKYARLESLDLICDRKDSFEEWMEGLSTLVSSSQWLTLFPPRYENTDPTILWLKQIWTCKSENHELKQQEAIKLVKKFIPSITRDEAKLVVRHAHNYQFKHTFNYGAALRWDGFVLMFHLLCDKEDLQLYQIFQSYALKHPKLGMTLEEFRRFLIAECHWLPTDAKPSLLHTLMKTHDDEHHQAIKKFCAGNQPTEYNQASKLLSFAGFLSFLRSKDNSIINLEHETVYQDMTQPLSHYFINSSHNTYLEGDQITSTSSTDAYVRALLQGCRCIEIDCWDGAITNGLSEREPVIYHGHTLTTKVPFRDVIHTINDYGFSSSIYPMVISIENHCSSSQQSRMAKVFRAIFGDCLPKDNLVELEGRERLPSPQELQGKIILKGSFKKVLEKKTGAKGLMKKMKTLPQIRTTPVSPPITSTTTSLPPAFDASAFQTPPSPKVTSPELPLSPQFSVNLEVSLSGSNVEQSLTTTVLEAEATPSPERQHRRLRPTRSLRESRRVAGGEDFPDGVIKISRQRRSLRVVKNHLQQEEQGQDDQELTFTETAEDLKVLIVYCRAVSIKPWDWNKQKATTISEMFSFGEPTAVELCKKCPRELLRCTERQLVRTYPKGTRFDSSNYDPMQMWNCGIQLVALNFQYPSIEMHLNQGLFRLNGGCGYVLKPQVMREEDPGGPGGRSRGKFPYSPVMMVPHPGVKPIQLEIELLSGQRLSSWRGKKCNFLTVDIQTYGIRHDHAKMKQAAHSNVFWPSWSAGEHVLQVEVWMPELCLVYFRVENEGRKVYGQNCFPLISLLPGIKFVPLRTNGGELIPESGLFVRIKKVEVEGTLSPKLEKKEEQKAKKTVKKPPKNKPYLSLPALSDEVEEWEEEGKGEEGKEEEEGEEESDGEVVLSVEVHPDDGSKPNSPVYSSDSNKAETTSL